MTDNTGRAAGEIVGALVGHYTALERRRASGLPFASSTGNALAGLLYVRMYDRLGSAVARDVALAEAERLCAPALERRGVAADIAGLAWATAPAVLPGRSRLRSVVRALQLGGGRRTPSDPVRLGWRVAHLTAARPLLLGSLRNRADAELRRFTPLLERHLARESPRAEVVLTSALAGLVVADAAAERLVRGTSPASATRELAAVVHAAGCAGLADAAAGLRAELVARRLDDGLPAAARGGREPETHAWVGLALVAEAPALERATGVFDPDVPRLPGFAIARAEAAHGGLRFVLESGGRRRERRFEAADLDVLLSTALAQLENEEPAKVSPRQHAHVALAAMLLAGRCGDAATGEALDRVVARSLAEILARQAGNGGWSYSHKHVRSTTYTPGRRDEADFADRQYTLDAAVPGIALCAAHAANGREHELAAAERAFAFFERSIRRVPWNGRRIWRLWPEDLKTPFMGTAVNYELWNACFFAAFAQVARDPQAAARARRYVDDAVDYAASLMTPEGDIGYGDYVDEKRTAYASWDALLLAAIADATGDPRAAALSRRILDRLAEVMAPSGAIPNVADHREAVPGGGTRHAVHRHGIGPYPIRTYYQLYYTAAAALRGGPVEPALRALGFVLVEFADPALAGVAPGTDGDGERIRRTAGVPGRDWLLTVFALLPRLGAFDYRPALGAARPAGERLRRAAEGLLAGLDEPSPGTDAVRGLGLAALAEAGAEAPRDAALACANRVRGQDGGWPACELLARAGMLTGDAGWMDASAAAAAAAVGEGAASALLAAPWLPAGERDEVAEAAAAALVRAQRPDGWWGDEAGAQASALAALLRRPAGDRAVDAALKRGGAAAFERYFSPRRDPAASLGADDAIALAAAFAAIGRRPASRGHSRYAPIATRAFFEAFVGPQGTFREHVEPLEAARAFAQLSLAAEAPEGLL